MYPLAAKVVGIAFVGYLLFRTVDSLRSAVKNGRVWLSPRARISLHRDPIFFVLLVACWTAFFVLFVVALSLMVFGLFRPWTKCMFGSHLSIAGGLHNALLQAEMLGCETTQVFTKNQKQWDCPPLEPAAAGEWRGHCKRLKFKRTVSHASYLINLASPDEGMWRKGVGLFVEEVSRCELLGIPYLVTHPGAHMGAGDEAGITRIVAALNVVLDRTPTAKRVTVCLEATAGQGTSVGHQLEHLAGIIGRVRSPRRFGVCLDTAHLFAAGYDFRGRRYARFRKELDRTLGVSRVKVLHLNDSKKDLGARVDRHEHIGRGLIGLDGFKPWVRDEAFRDVPKILETEKGTCPDTGRDWDAINLEVLRSLQ